SKNHSYKSSTHRSVSHRPNGAHMRPPLRTSGPRPHGNSMRPPFRPAGHRPHGPSMNPRRPTMNVNNLYRAPWVPTVNRYVPPVNKKFSTGRRNFPTANRKFPTASKKFTTGNTENHTTDMGRKGKAGSSQNNIDDKGFWDSGCSRHMTGNISYLFEFEPFDGGYVSFGQGGCKITGKGTIKTDSECLVLGRNFKLLDDTNILLRTPRQHNMYSIDLNNIVPHKDLTCLVAKASADECILWHRRLGHLNVKTMNKLVRYNLVRGLPTKSFDNDHTCTDYLKGKQHKASCKSKLVNSVTKPLHTLHMDLFGPTSVSSISHKWYCLVVTDDFSRFTWTFFLRSKDETSDILKKFITEVENLKDYKVKIIRCDNKGEFRNKEINDFFSQKGIKREFSNARTPQQNGVAEKRNMTLIEAARTMLTDSKLHTTFRLKQLILLAMCRIGNGPNWLFDIDVLTNLINYVPVITGYILMPLWKYGLLFDSTSKNATNDEPKSSYDAGNKDDNGVNKDSAVDAHEKEFEALMHEKFQMSAMGELNFFLGLPVLQKEDGIFLSQDKYIGDILKKFGFLDVRSSNTPMDKENPWGKDGPGKDGHPKLGLWYPKALSFNLVAYSDSDYGGASQDLKSTTGRRFTLLFGILRVPAAHITLPLVVILPLLYFHCQCKLFPLLGQLSTVSVFLGFGLTFAGTSKLSGVLRILMIGLKLIPLVSKDEITMNASCKTCWSCSSLRHCGVFSYSWVILSLASQELPSCPTKRS
nr:putative ribonuclease H-like domain-containing protein [Tanacetum cinerariifolium]